MLKRFSVKGFKNFSEKIELDFSKIRDYKFKLQCLTNGLVSKAIIYGKNSAGKTNLGLAIFDIVAHLTNKNVTPGLYSYYLSSTGTYHYAEFNYVFQFGKDVIEYSYRKNESQELIYDKLILNENLIYDYDYQKETGDLHGINAIAPTLNWVFKDTDCILKYVVNNTVLSETDPLRKMITFVSEMLWFRNLDENRYIGYKTNSKDYLGFIFENDNLKEFEAFLHMTGIKDSLIAQKDTDGVMRLYFDNPVPLPFFKTASSGTRALYTFYYWYKTAPKVSLIFIDEFDAYYHYELSEYIVKILEKMTNTQVLITSHNTNLLTNKIMRPDCYYILSNNRLVDFADATDRELREGHNLEKLYMSGEFDV